MQPEIKVIKPDQNFSREIGLFLASLEKIRTSWQSVVKDLTKNELAEKILPAVQPIGTIIIHIAESEYYWIQCVVAGKEFSDEIKNLMHYDLWFKNFAEYDLDIDYCLKVVENVHQITRQTLSAFKDEDLEKLFVRKYQGKETHISLRWIFTHLLEHDAEHKGQILMVKRLMREKNMPNDANQ